MSEQPSLSDMRDRLSDTYTARELLYLLSDKELTALYSKVALLMGWDEDEADVCHVCDEPYGPDALCDCEVEERMDRDA